MASACFSGALGGVVGSPFYLMKIRLQSHSDSAKIGYQHDYKGTTDALRKILRDEKFSGLFRGWRAMALRVATGSAVQFSTYDQSKRFILDNSKLIDGVLVYFLSSLISGFFVTVAMNPFDVISTRIYNEGTKNGKGLLYNGVFDCILKMMKTEGVTGFYKGFVAHYTRLAPHTILTFLFYEKLKSIFPNKDL
jgi:solute carrier family 25, member 34/35